MINLIEFIGQLFVLSISDRSPVSLKFFGGSMFAKSTFIKIGALSILLSLILSACAAPETPSVPEPVAATPLPVTPPLPLPTPADTQTTTRFIEITDVQVQIGVGSPIPVDVIASGSWPDLCAQVAGIKQRLDGTRFEIEILATPAAPNCPPDLVGIAFRMAFPLNMTGLPFGSYTVEVNGLRTDFEWSATSTEPIPVENLGLTFAYIGANGNLWIADASGGPPRHLTSDAATQEASGEVISYTFPKISSDGRFIAVRRDAGVPVAEGLKYQFGLWVYDTETGESRSVHEDPISPPAGFDWKPGTHLLAYGIGSDPNYFIIRGEKPDPNLAMGIYTADLDSGVSSLFVEPQNGYSLIQPAWSPDGRFLSFDELIYMEGRGPFAYYDFDNQQYIAWDEPIGNYDWSPDGSTLAYDRLTYTASGTERIFTRPRQDGAEVQVSPDVDQGYAFYPVYSPDGLQIAYLVNPGGPESFVNTLVVQDLATGESRELGSYVSVWYLEWSSDGKALVFSAGPYESQVVYGYDLVNGGAKELAQGSQPTLAQP
jgi:Tol biopolymer transport system component